MKIAILGWGSLTWRPENLAIDKNVGSDGWLSDGPSLPIEFARISSDGRLTLVITKSGVEVETLYAISSYAEMEEAILDLALREGSGRNKIGSFKKEGSLVTPNDFRFAKNISQWLESKPEIDAVIWTNLAKKFRDEIHLDLTPENAVNYLMGLPQDIQAKAEEYVRKAPAVIDTPVRRAIEEKLGWKIITN